MKNTTDNRIAVSVQGINKTFKLPNEKHSGIKSAVVNFHKRKKGYQLQHVLSDITFDIKEGEFFGIVGRNGSGKSTLLKLLAGVYAPDSGGIHVNGTLMPFIELGVGFNGELTGRENIFLNGALLGFNRKEMLAMYKDIVAFAELEPFMDQKLKNYSSGMQVRLAFSIAIRARSDVLLLDEVLAVGDVVFQKKCFNYFKQLKRDKKTVVFISHDTNALLEYCDSGILIDKGKIISRGNITDVVNDYIDLLNEVEEKQSEQAVAKHDKQKRWGTGDIFVDDAHVKHVDGSAKQVFTDRDEYIDIEVSYLAKRDILEPVYGISITDSNGDRLFTSNTLWLRMSTGELKAGKIAKVCWRVPNVFNSGDFSVSPAVANADGSTMYDWLQDATFFKVRKRLQSTAQVNVEHTIDIKSS